MDTAFKNLNVKDLSDNRKLWKTSKPYFSNKGFNSNKFLLKENDNLVSDENQELATIMNNFFKYQERLETEERQ